MQADLSHCPSSGSRIPLFCSAVTSIAIAADQLHYFPICALGSETSDCWPSPSGIPLRQLRQGAFCWTFPRLFWITYRLVYLSPNCVKLFAAIAFASDLNVLSLPRSTNLPWSFPYLCRFILTLVGVYHGLPFHSCTATSATVFCAGLNGDPGEEPRQKRTPLSPMKSSSFCIVSVLLNQEIR